MKEEDNDTMKPLPSGVGTGPSEEDEDEEASGSSVLTGKRQVILPGIDVRCFFLSEERDELYHYIDTRCEAMLKAGLFEEVTKLLVNDALTPDSVAGKSHLIIPPPMSCDFVYALLLASRLVIECIPSHSLSYPCSRYNIYTL